MANSKNNTNKKKGVRVGGKKKVAMVRGTAKKNPGIDTSSAAFLRLLSDPCGAPLTGAPYGGVAGTNYFRFRNVVTPGPQVVDATLQFCPGHVDAQGIGSNGIGAIQYTSTNTTATFPTTLYGTQISSIFTSGIGSVRCVGACIKLLYTGTEMERKGQVGTTIVVAPFYNGSGNAAGVAGLYPAVPTLFNSYPKVRRLGEVMHEVRWAPGFEDQQFIELNDNPQNISPYVPGAAIAMSVLNAPPGSITFEIYSCWEATPPTSAGTNMVVSLKAPTSSNTLNEVLRTIGNITNFAVNTGNVIIPGIRSGLAAVAKYGPAVASIM